MHLKSRSWIYWLVIVFIFQSCGTSSVYENATNFQNENWSSDSAKVFNFEINDDGNYDVLYLVKNRTDYPFSNLYLSSDLRNESTLVSKELQEVTLFHPKTGKPYGKGFGGVMEHKFYSLRNQKLSKGNYSLRLNHYMREQNLDGLISIGIRVDKSSE